MKRVYPLTIQDGMSQSGSYILMLGEPDSGVQVPIFIGAYEAQSIMLAKELIQTRRPMTHELMQHIMEDYGLSVTQVTIDRVVEGIFYATVYVTDGFTEKHFDSRTSDAITLALINACPILMDEKVLEETGVNDNGKWQTTDGEGDTEDDLERLEQELRRCEQREDYERAAEIQDRINKLRKL